MPALRPSGFALALLVAASGPALAEGPTIEHSAIKCLVAGKYRKMPARFAPPEVAQPRVYFRPEGVPSWYYVEMKPEAALGHVGVLPKPTKKLVGQHIEYYVEAASKDFDTGRTPEYDPIVVAKDSECTNDPVAAFYSSDPPPAVFPSVPEGFAVGGGVAGGTVAAIVGGGAAAGTAAVLLAKGGDEEQPPPPVTQPPVTSPPATNPPVTQPPVTPGADVACQADPRQGAAPLQVKFSAQATGGNGVFDYAWTFGDGGTSNQVNPSHTYTTPGTYEARVVATSGDRSATCARIITVLPRSFRLQVDLAGGGTGNVAGDGIACPNDCGEEYAPGASVTLSAAATGGSTFAGWSGACSGTGTCTVTMDGDRAVTATFNPPPSTFPLNVTVGGNGSGTVTGTGAAINCPPTCQANVLGGSTVQLTAAPAAGSTFGGWGGDCVGATGLTCTLVMNGPHNVSATFNPPPTFVLTVTVAGTGTGTVNGSLTCTSGTCSQSFPAGTPITLNANPSGNSTFGGWSGDCVGAATCNLTMDGPRSVTATFNAIPTVRLTLTVTGLAGGAGRVNINPSAIGGCSSSPTPGNVCTVDYLTGEPIVLTAVVTAGFFSGYTGDCAGTKGDVCNLQMTQNRTVEAIFDQLTQPPAAGAASLTTAFDVAGARGQVMLNGVVLPAPDPGTRSWPVTPAVGENRLEAQIVAAGKAGTWRFDLSGIPGLQRGSLRVLAGEVVAVGPDTVVFRSTGRAGERLGFAFTSR